VGMAAGQCSCPNLTRNACEQGDWCFAAAASTVGAATLRNLIFGGALRVPSFDIKGEKTRPRVHWLHIEIVKSSLLNVQRVSLG
jgi:hypothetical protein